MYEEYALLDAQIKVLENKKDELRTYILQDMIDNGTAKKPTPLGNFTIAKLKRYEYPEYVIEAGENYKAMKVQSERTGEAIETEVESLKFTSVKL